MVSSLQFYDVNQYASCGHSVVLRDNSLTIVDLIFYLEFSVGNVKYKFYINFLQQKTVCLRFLIVKIDLDLPKLLK